LANYPEDAGRIDYLALLFLYYQPVENSPSEKTSVKIVDTWAQDPECPQPNDVTPNCLICIIDRHE